MMACEFIHEDFLLETETAKRLYHDHAAKCPIYDYHCHLPVGLVANDTKFENMSQIWLSGDHYKWRAMRTNGVDERFCTGNASDWEKFQAWAQTVPHCLRNPLYHWTAMELKRPFGITQLLSPATAKDIYDKCSELLKTPQFSARGIMRQMNVKLVCTTDDPVDDLKHHRKIAADGFEIKVYPAWRPDKGMTPENTVAMNEWLDKLSAAADIEIKNFDSYLAALRNRHDFFHANNCRLSDRGLETAYAEDYTDKEIEKIFDKIRGNKKLDASEILKFKSAMLYEFAIMDAEKGWVQQFHFGALRNNNTRLFRSLGPDTGFDSIGDFELGRPLVKLLDRLDSQNKLAKTILYNLNPRDNEMLGTIIGCYQDGSVAGKMQLGSGWWFLDQKDGMEKQMTALSSLGLLSRFVGMLTDSRSFLSYPRHEYFRRILCNMLGNDVKLGLIPNDMQLLGQMVENISFNNAKNYFGMKL
jgi:glucuronate isomerase